ncbi:MAG TPA: thiamine phosphate synthase [Rhizomicrobium sp.]
MNDRCRLYLITPSELEPASFASALMAALEAGDVASVQLRLKGAADDDIRRAADRLMPIVQSAGVAFILNDRADLAAEFGADGVHIGQSDVSYREARDLVGRDRVVGITCHASRHLAIEAADAGANYVAFGAFHPTRTKETIARADIDLLAWWSELMIVPCVAIGGITIDNASPLIEAGADFLAVCSAVWQHVDGPAAAVKRFNALF